MPDKTGLSISSDTETRGEKRVISPPLFRVYLLNDDYTTMEFVVEILEEVFHKNAVEATRIMIHVHKNGMGLAGIYTFEIAETKVTEVHELAREHGFPLKCKVEEE